MRFLARRRVAPVLGAALSVLGIFTGVTWPRHVAAADPTVVVIVDGPGADALADQLTKDDLGGLKSVERSPKSVPCSVCRRLPGCIFLISAITPWNPRVS